MLLSRLFARRAARKRQIFVYHDGRRNRWVDPMLVEEVFEREGGENWQQTVVEVRNLHRPHNAALSASLVEQRKETRRRETGKLLDWTRKAFKIEPLGPDGSGLSEAETIGVLTEYLHFCRGLATAARPLSDSPAPTEASPATP